MVNQPTGNHGLGFKVKRGYPNLKVSYNLLIIGPRGLQSEINL